MNRRFLDSPFSVMVLVLLLMSGSTVFGKIFHSKTEAMELAFGENPDVDMMPLFLTDHQLAKVEKMAHGKIDSALFTFYVGRRNGEITGYAAIESHTVRTKPETLLILLSPEGELKHIEVLAFHEPPEYQPTDLWFAQLYRRTLSQLDFNNEVQGITGATLSAQSALSSVRKVLAIYQLVVKEG